MSSLDSGTAIPKYGLKLKLNHRYPEKWSQTCIPRWQQLILILPLVLRYIYDYIKSMCFGKSIVMDYLKVVNGQQIYGVPIGGIGGGTIGRGYRGEFCRYQLIPGQYEYNTVEANQFIVTIKDTSNNTLFQSLLSTYERKSKHIKTWEQLLDPNKCNYTGLYPRSWTQYDLSDYGIKLTCRQVSPVIPHNYKDASLPCAMFIWSIENIGNEDRRVTISFTFKNGTGHKRDKNSPCSSKSFSYLESSGVVLYNSINKMPCAYALAAKVKDNATISKCLSFDPNSDGKAPWDQLHENGCFDKFSKNETDQVFKEMACGIAVQVQVTPSDTQETEMCLVWDMPTVSFPKGDKKYNRFYTKYFGSENATLKMVDYAFKNFKDWETAIYNWQRPILEDVELPDWYKSALFNETYFVSDGGTIWFTLSNEESEKLPVTDIRQKYGRFAYLEGHEYKMYNTYDVHFYASFALIMNWPNLQLSLQYDMKDFIGVEIPTRVRMWYDGVVAERKVKNTLPHDIGDPGEDPIININSYPVHDVSDWRDLNIKFVLQVLRDYNLTRDVKEVTDRKKYLEDMYDVCCTVMEKTLCFDKDKDGVIENGGYPDQTYDMWIMTGTSAYCGGLWLAALYAMVVISRELNKHSDEDKYATLLEKGKIAYEAKLWNGRYYNFDEIRDTVMSDQMCGHWYLRSCGYEYEALSLYTRVTGIVQSPPTTNQEEPPEGYYAFVESPNAEPPRVRPPPYTYPPVDCKEDDSSPHSLYYNICGDLNKGSIPRNPMGQNVFGSPYPFDLIRNQTLKYLSRTLPILKADETLPKVAQFQDDLISDNSISNSYDKKERLKRSVEANKTVVETAANEISESRRGRKFCDQGGVFCMLYKAINGELPSSKPTPHLAVERRDDVTATRYEGPPTPCPAKVEYATPVFAKNYQGIWRYVVQIPYEGYFTQTVEVTRCLQSRCHYLDGGCLSSPRWSSLLVAEIYYPDAILSGSDTVYPQRNPVSASQPPPVQDFQNYQQYLHKRAGLQANPSDLPTTAKPAHCDGVDSLGCFQVRLYYDWFLIPGSCKCWRPDYFSKYSRRKTNSDL